jgi:hypothetical protein
MTKMIASTATGLLAISLLASDATPRTGEAVGQDDHPLTLKVIRTDQEGMAYYQGIALKNDSYRFSEQARRTVLESTLADFDVERDDRGHLAGFHLLMRAEPERRLPAPEGGQAAALPGSRSTSYLDIDGDSVLDVMVKSGPGLSETSILHEDRWVRVNNRKGKIVVGSKARSDDGTDYVFIRGGWTKTR